MKMKLTLLMCLSVLFRVSLSERVEPEEVRSQIQTYAEQRAMTVRAVRGGRNTMSCYNEFMPQISAVAESGRNGTEACIASGMSSLEEEKNKTATMRSNLNTYVNLIKDSLTKCDAQDAILDYLSCEKTESKTNKENIENIAYYSSDYITQLSEAYNSINATEKACIARVIIKAEKDTDDLFVALEHCLINGLADLLIPSDPGDGGDAGNAGVNGGDDGNAGVNGGDVGDNTAKDDVFGSGAAAMRLR